MLGEGLVGQGQAIPGGIVILAGLVYNGILLTIGLATAGLTQASGEVLPKFGEFPVLSGLWHAMETHEHSGGRDGRIGRRSAARRRQQLLALIVTASPQEVADHILQDLHRGVTALHGRGMYSQQEREVLMVAFTMTEMPQLKAIVSAADPNAFVIVSPAREVLGRGFQPLDK